ncbi:MAG: hypothetical protein P0Y60_04430 [Candidatus Microbacterium colombiense]|nr:MAG: hypothetical protein P0Y60_04430 [Microbacterium sp.]
MTTPRIIRSVAVALIVFSAAALAGCAPETNAAEPSASPTATHESSTRSPEPSASTAPPQTQAPETPAAFTEAELAQICIDATRSTYDPGVTFDAAGARIEKRTVTPEWLVLVPAQTNGYAGESVCTIGGSPSSPQVEMSSGSIQPLTEEQIQKLIRGENEGGTE